MRREPRAHANARVRANYSAERDVTGPLRSPVAVSARLPHGAEDRVVFRPVGSLGRRLALVLIVSLNVVTAALFIGWALLPEHVPSPVARIPLWLRVLGQVIFCLVIIGELIRVAQSASVCVLGLNAKDPVPVEPQPGLRVAFLTTIVPSKEPVEIVAATLREMKRVDIDGQLDVWLLDEGDDDAVKAVCRELGVHHFSRKGRPEYNQAEGPFRAKTKCGNHNAWRAEHEHHYDVVAQLDPDHVPFRSFLQRTLGYFRDPDVAFVVAPQVYGNPYDSLVSYGASGQQYLFSGLIERGGNGMDAPILIGTNHLYRPACWAQIGGYQDSIIEDHLTSMHVQAATNPATGHRWKGVYTPDVLAIGEGPVSWADYFNQQARWAYGVWQIILSSKLRPKSGLGFRRRLAYALVQFYYPSVAIAWACGFLATAAYLVLGATSVVAEPRTWFLLWGASVGSWFVMWFWLRRYYLAAHERRQLGLRAMLLTLLTGPVYLAAAVAALLRRPLAYKVTAKGALATRESLGTFRTHFAVAVAALAIITAGLLLHHTAWSIAMWAGVPLIVGVATPMIALLSRPATVTEPAAVNAPVTSAGEMPVLAPSETLAPVPEVSPARVHV